MGHSLTLSLTSDQHAELVRLRDTAPKPHIRERAAALLKVAAGISAKQVARSGLLKARREETVAGWVHRYRDSGAAGLSIRPGHGRKPAFSPSPPHAPGRHRRGPGGGPSLAPARGPGPQWPRPSPAALAVPAGSPVPDRPAPGRSASA